jgi:serine/threonine protein phosphatase 1
MPRTLVIGDIHGGLKALNQVMNKCALRHADKLIFLGDYVDGWSESYGVIDFLIKICTTYDCIFIKGNHDVWAERWLKDEETNDVWLASGGIETIESYRGISADNKLKHLRFLEHMPYFHQDEANRLFIHAGFTSMHGPTHEMYNTNFNWDRTLWETALAIDQDLQIDDIYYPRRLKLFREIFIGHTPTINFQETLPMHKANVWNIDTGAAFNGKLTMMDIDSKEYWQSSPLPELYPDEKGRKR